MTDKNESINGLLAISHPDQWKDFIFNLQSTLIENGHVESLTKSGRSDFAARLQGLYCFFATLEKPEKES